jgi:AcrR family transcriptional regulator
VTDEKARTRQQILQVAARLLERDGVQAVSTRSVAAAAGIRAASLYQLFGDKDGLLAALAIHGFDLYLSAKHTLTATDDPVADMRRGWDLHVDFGLRHPAFYLLMFGTDRPGHRPPAADQVHDLLLRFLDNVAAAGRLRIPPPLAARLCAAAVTGVTLSLIGTPAGQREAQGSGAGEHEAQISARMRDTLIDSLVTGPQPPVDTALPSRALALDAALTAADHASVPLRPTETALLHDWLHRLAGA